LPRVEENLALDEALLIEADERRGRPALRFWEAADYAVVLGASRRKGSDVFCENCQADKVPVLRRSSGGGTVLIGPGALNVTVVLAEWAAPGLAAVDVAQRYVLERIAASIRKVGPTVGVEGLGDLVLGDRKCGGSAQRRLKQHFMVHCSILYDFAICRIARYLAIPQKQPAYRAGRSHEDFLSNLGLPRRILADAIQREFSPGSGPDDVPPLPMGLVETLLFEKFSNPEWIQRL
jgi:lipoate-protein ligase A